MLAVTILSQEKLTNMPTIMINYLSFYLTTTSRLIDRRNRSGSTSSYSGSRRGVRFYLLDISHFVQPNIGKYLCKDTRIYFHAGTNSLFTDYPNI